MARGAGAGRPPKPIEEHILAGTYKPSRHGPLAPADLPGPPPEKPGDLSPVAAECWDRVLAVRAGVVKPSDRDALVVYCEWWSLWVETLAMVREADGGGRAQLMTSLAIATDKLAASFSRFGLSPSDRAKLRIETTGPAAPKVRSRQPTKLDKAGAPK